MQPVILDQGPGAETRTLAVARTLARPRTRAPRLPGRWHGGRAGAGNPPAWPGGPRAVEQAEQAIIEATLDLFAEQGFEGVCVEAVAARAGVGKATIYRRWPNKEELLLAAFGSLKSPFPEPGGVSVRDDLLAMVKVMCADRADPRKARGTRCCSARGTSTRG